MVVLQECKNEKSSLARMKSDCLLWSTSRKLQSMFYPKWQYVAVTNQELPVFVQVMLRNSMHVLIDWERACIKKKSAYWTTTEKVLLWKHFLFPSSSAEREAHNSSESATYFLSALFKLKFTISIHVLGKCKEPCECSYEFVLRRSGRSVSGNRFWKRYLVQIFLQLSANYIVLLILCHFDPS